MKFLIVILLVGTLSFSAEHSKREIGKDNPNICLLLLTKALPKGAVDFSGFKGITSVRNIHIHERSVKGLENLIKYSETREMLFQAMIRMGLINPEPEIHSKLINPEFESDDELSYVNWMLLSRNKVIDFREEKQSDDPIVQRIIEERKKFFSTELANVDILEPVPEHHRNIQLQHIFLQKMERFFNDPESVKVLNSYLSNVQREFDKFETLGSFDKQTMLENIQGHTNALATFGIYVPKDLDEKMGMAIWLTKLPYVDKFYQAVNAAYLRFKYSKDARQKAQLLVGTENNHQKISPGTMQLHILNNDPSNLTKKAKLFFEKYLNGEHTFSKQFEKDLNMAYPELSLLFASNASDRVIIDQIFPDGIYGQGTSELYKVIRRASIALEVAKGENYEQIFPFMSSENFKLIQSLMHKDLEILKESGEVNYQMLDYFFTILMLDTVGRGSDPHLKWVTEYKGINQKFGANFEQKTHALLELDPFISFSLAKHTNQDQETIINLFKLIAQNNIGQNIQMEKGPKCFEDFIGVSKDDIEIILFRFLFSVAGLTNNPKSVASELLNDELVTIWHLLYEKLPLVAKKEMTSEELYTEMVKIKASFLGVDYKNDLSKEVSLRQLIAKMRLASQARVKKDSYTHLDEVVTHISNTSLGEQILNSFREFGNTSFKVDFEDLVNILNDEPTISFYSADMYQAIKRNLNAEHENFAQAHWIKLLYAGFRKVGDHRLYQNAIDQLPEGIELPIMFNRIVDYLDDGVRPQDINPEDIVARYMDDYYQIIIPKFEFN